MIAVIKDRHTGSIETVTNVTRIENMKQDRITQRNSIRIWRLSHVPGPEATEVEEGVIKLNDSEFYLLPQD
jgi:hypothetical protein